MMGENERERMERFERELHRWGSRPPVTPPEEAAARLVDTLPPAPTRFPVWRMAAAAAAVVLLVCGSWAGLRFGGGSRPATPPPDDATAEFVPPPLDENVVLWWLDDETPVYFVLNSGDAG
jgi:hypothetical protein